MNAWETSLSKGENLKYSKFVFLVFNLSNQTQNYFIILKYREKLKETEFNKTV